MFQAIIDADNSRLVSRQPQSSVRLTANLDNGIAVGTVELSVDSRGYWSVLIGPAPGRLGEWETVASGELLAAED